MIQRGHDRRRDNAQRDDQRGHRRLRLRRHGRRAYIRSAYSLPSLATLGNAICGFASMYVASLDPRDRGSPDPWTKYFFEHHFVAAAYLIFIAMIFDALDGRLARFTRHTTDFGGQLDSLADVISFGAAPAFLALQVFHDAHRTLYFPVLTRLIWSIGALYLSCAALRLARFNVSNEHGEQHHFSFLGLPSPGAAAAVAAWVLMQRDLLERADPLLGDNAWRWLAPVSSACVWVLPLIVLIAGLLMVSAVRYPHVVNRYLRGRRSFGQLLAALILLLLLVVSHRVTLGVTSLGYMLCGPLSWAYMRYWPRKNRPIVAAAVALPPQSPSADSIGHT